ncbi:MFS transporter [Pseudonocardia sp. NPDC049154]|uniref:MFS transporter n=1 Tax=Pseudonocardia sp. NPDC049154 TaxID=3155501 RepID=UPI0033E33C65
MDPHRRVARLRCGAAGRDRGERRRGADRAGAGRGVAGGQWVVNAYTVTFAALILTAGAVGDRIGARRLFAGGFVLFTPASVACGLAPGLGTLIAARAVQGVGAAVLVPCSLALVAHAHPAPAARAGAVGIWAAGASVALSAGPLLGGRARGRRRREPQRRADAAARAVPAAGVRAGVGHRAAGQRRVLRADLPQRVGRGSVRRARRRRPGGRPARGARDLGGHRRGRRAARSAPGAG